MVWRSFDAEGPPALVWIRPVTQKRCVLLLGAFDPPTKAHVALVETASRHARLAGAFCLTKVLLGRPPDELLRPERRLELLDALGASHGLGLAAANRGTYLEVARAARSAGCEPLMLVGSDKLPQLKDPSFYADGPAGVKATFAEVEFLVVSRGGEGEKLLDDPALARISASEVRERVRRGMPVDDLVPPVVALALRGYTRD